MLLFTRILTLLSARFRPGKSGQKEKGAEMPERPVSDRGNCGEKPTQAGKKAQLRWSSYLYQDWKLPEDGLMESGAAGADFRRAAGWLL